MKIIFLLLLSLFLSRHLAAQIRGIGCNTQEIASQFNGIESQIAADGSTILTGKTDESRLAFIMFMSDDDICRLAIIVPLTPADLHGVIEHANSKYVITSESEWKVYSDKGVATLSVEKVNGELVFVCRLIKQF